MAHLPEPVKPHRVPVIRPALVRAAVSPTAVAATAAGAGIGALDHSVVVAVVLAAVGWSGRMVAALVAQRRRDRAALPHPAELDPWSVPAPWRELLQQALGAQSRFDQLLASWPAGPTRDRLDDLRPRVYAEVADLGVLARQGAAAEGWTGAAFASVRPGAKELATEMEEVRTERIRLGDRASERVGELARREEALAAQLRALHHRQAVSAELQDRLRAAVARLDETITVLLTLDAHLAGEPTRLSSALDELNDGVVSLRAALAETSGPPTDPGTP